MALLRAVPWFLCTLCSWFVTADLDVELYRTAKKSPDLKAVEGDVQKISETWKWWKIGWLVASITWKQGHDWPSNSGQGLFFDVKTCRG